MLLYRSWDPVTGDSDGGSGGSTASLVLRCKTTPFLMDFIIEMWTLDKVVHSARAFCVTSCLQTGTELGLIRLKP